MQKWATKKKSWSTERLDKTLASHDLSNEEAIKCRLKNELLHSSPLENRDTEEYRAMYREGPQGTPWPQFNFPAFKVIELCAWPLSAREVVVHCFEVEFLEDDLLIFVLNSVTDTKSVDRSTHGFPNDGISEIKEAEFSRQ
ncbi:hypothetical protein C5167_043552 [Papaver somniferum]|uniref:Uncharacterized protein n=1 Tax=Papaver somniferum TaxID=3469 RepID=A0A4Y7L9V8_PAPSO|nr:hypothetical protein C5167_043552 [Papaver somniferum]